MKESQPVWVVMREVRSQDERHFEHSQILGSKNMRYYLSEEEAQAKCDELNKGRHRMHESYAEHLDSVYEYKMKAHIKREMQNRIFDVLGLPLLVPLQKPNKQDYTLTFQEYVQAEYDRNGSYEDYRVFKMEQA